ncbi:hypothetical protein [Maricaulis parjimensis]|uniref:hypothetical protein n=1 Tax=Maricaulis parjimensis TaxID=144023 RepID=UPI00193ACF21|nr:hypothetical protein [Maricaulis parjimensis]
MWNRIRSWLGLGRPETRPQTVATSRLDADRLPSAGSPERRAEIRKALSWVLAAPLEAVDDRLRPHLLPVNRDAFERSPSELVRLTQATLQAEPDLLPTYLFHGNGHVRQTALEQLTADTLTPFTFVALCLRCNDWVDEVRNTALDRLKAVLPDLEPELLKAVLPALIRRMPSWRRMLSTRWAISAPAQPGNLSLILSVPAAQKAAIDSLLEHRPGPTTRMVLALARFDWLDEHLERLAVDAPAPGVRRVAVSALLTGSLRWPVRRKPAGSTRPGQVETVLDHRPVTCQSDRASVFRLAARDRASSVRALAADALISDGPGAFARQDWAHLAKDKRHAVRSRMNFFHRKWVEKDLPDYLQT